MCNSGGNDWFDSNDTSCPRYLSPSDASSEVGSCDMNKI